ncbi:unnamed protein product, partial [Discosporangium mesarthrocarpum]
NRGISALCRHEVVSAAGKSHRGGLAVLRVSGNQLTDEGAEDLAGLLSEHRCRRFLRELDISNNHITIQGFNPLVVALQECKQLMHLDVRGCTLGPDALTSTAGLLVAHGHEGSQLQSVNLAPRVDFAAAVLSDDGLADALHGGLNALAKALLTAEGVTDLGLGAFLFPQQNHSASRSIQESLRRNARRQQMGQQMGQQIRQQVAGSKGANTNANTNVDSLEEVLAPKTQDSAPAPAPAPAPGAPGTPLGNRSMMPPPPPASHPVSVPSAFKGKGKSIGAGRRSTGTVGEGCGTNLRCADSKKPSGAISRRSLVAEKGVKPVAEVRESTDRSRGMIGRVTTRGTPTRPVSAQGSVCPIPSGPLSLSQSRPSKVTHSPRGSLPNSC